MLTIDMRGNRQSRRRLYVVARERLSRRRQMQRFQCAQQPVDVGFLVRRRQRDAQPRLAGGHGRRADRGHQQALPFQCLRRSQRGFAAGPSEPCRFKMPATTP